MIHDLKIKKEYLDRLTQGIKKSEIRDNDRDYQLGDILRFKNPKSYSVNAPDYTFLFVITHIHSGLGMAHGYVCLSVRSIDE